MIESKHAVIHGRNWEVLQFTGTKSVQVFFAVTKAVGPALAEALNKAKPGQNPLETDIDFSRVVQLLLESSKQPSDVQRLLDTLLQNTIVDRQPMSSTVFDDVFSGPKILHLGPVLKFVMEANYGDFRGALAIFTDQSSDSANPGEGSASSPPN